MLDTVSARHQNFSFTDKYLIQHCREAPWASGSEYVYRLHALSVSDIPELGSQAAGIRFDAQMIVHCRDAGSIIVKVLYYYFVK